MVRRYRHNLLSSYSITVLSLRVSRPSFITCLVGICADVMKFSTRRNQVKSSEIQGAKWYGIQETDVDFAKICRI